MRSLLRSFRELLRYPTAVVGLALILGLVLFAIYAVISLPYSEAIALWRGEGRVWYRNPKIAAPVWTNFFATKKLPEGFYMLGEDGSATRTDVINEKGFKDVTFTYTFEYVADEFPQELGLHYTVEFAEKQPFASAKWLTPDGREIDVVEMGVSVGEIYYFSQDERLSRRLGRMPAYEGLFADPESDPENPIPMKGEYQLEVFYQTFEEETEIVESEFVLYGRVHGVAGTDHRRRDIMVALLWGAPIALAFGLVASVGINLFTIFIAAVSAWFGGIVDNLIQRTTEVNLTLPFLSILVMVGTFYSKSLAIMLGMTVLLSIFGAAVKSYRAIFLQVKESTYIEAAQAYGASNTRIIFLYLIPRIIPMIIPNLVLSIPTFVFLEATLAQLSLGDPTLPTWGKVIYDAVGNAAVYNGQFYWVLEPALLLTVTGFGFALVGFSLDRVFNPRLRTLE